MSSLRRVCVFCGSRPGGRTEYIQSAKAFGAALAQARVGLVYGGASVGMMGALADAALAGGGEVIGVMPQRLVDREIAHRGLSELRVVQSMAERKAVMDLLADGFVALPGGFGTLDELFEMLTAAQLGMHRKPVGLLEVLGFFAPLMEWVDRAARDGFVPEQHARALIVEQEPTRLLERMTEGAS